MRKAITLIELLVVIIVLAVLALLVLPGFKGIIERAKFKEVKSMVDVARSGSKYYDLKYGLDQLDVSDQDALWSVLKITLPTTPKCEYIVVDGGTAPSGKQLQVISPPGSGEVVYTYDLPDGPGTVITGHTDEGYLPPGLPE
jgi:Tfp pilus assembly protein PilE